MTKEEAADIISGYEVYGCGYCLQGCDEVEEALRLAIDTLRQETVIRCKDCDYYQPDAFGDKRCYMNEFGSDDEGFCSWALRKEE